MHVVTPSAGLRAALLSVRARVVAAASRAGRDPAAVRVVAVTKTVGLGVVLDLVRLGQADFGENRPLALEERRRDFEAAAAADPALRAVPVRWHLIGHVQRNKVRRGLPAADVVHSVDSIALAETLDAEASRAGRPVVPVLLQVNVSGEATKGGFEPADFEDVLRRVAALPHLRAEGLMTMAPLARDAEEARPVFRRLRELRDWARASGYLLGLDLSMGMSEDFEVAVEEGATMLRIGRALVGTESP